MKLAVVGTGYVGLTTGAMFADRGNDVVCIDKDSAKILKLRAGKMTFFEPGLEDIVNRATRNGKLRFENSFGENVGDADVTFLAVGTPSREDGAFNLDHVTSAAREVGAALRSASDFKVVVGKSTVYQGAWEDISDSISEGLNGSQIQWAYVSNPETLAEGSAVRDFSKPDRVIIGTRDPRALKIMERLYSPFVKQQGKIISGSPADAELAKLGANILLANKVAMWNELARIADCVPRANIETIRHMICTDPRIGYQFSYPGPGYGGSCFPKDVRGATTRSRELGFDPKVISQIDDSNKDHKRYAADKAWRLVDKPEGGPVFGIWGVTFKPGTDDVRDSPALTIIPQLIGYGATARVFDPQDSNARRELGKYVNSGKLSFATKQYDVVAGADALMLLTEWEQFHTLDYGALEQMRGRNLFDFRNRWNPEESNEQGFSHYGIGVNYPLRK